MMSQRLLNQRSKAKSGHAASTGSLPEIQAQGGQHPQLTLMTKEQLVHRAVSEKRMKTLWGGGAMKKPEEKNQAMTEYDEVAKLNFYGSRRHTLKIDTTVPKIVRNRNVMLAPMPRSASKEELADRRAALEMKVHEFMIEDQILDDQIANAETREEHEALQKKKEERAQRIAEYKEKLLEQKKAEMKQEEQERLANRKARKPPRAPQATALATLPTDDEQRKEMNEDLVSVHVRCNSTDPVVTGHLKPILKEASSYQKKREEALQ